MMMLTNNFAKAEVEEPPSQELLEFLGQAVKVEDEYLDPISHTDLEIHSATEANRRSKVLKTSNDDE